MPSKCEILFENNVSRLIHSGQQVNGCVMLTFDREEIAKSILLILYGKGECRWKKKGRYRKYYKYNGNESYLNQQIYLLGNIDEVEETTISPGLHIYPFSLRLPLDLPSSLTSQHGSIEYKTSVTIYRPRSTDQSFGQIFSVIKPLDLNINQTLKETICMKKNFRFSPVCCGCCCLCCCDSEPLFLEAQIPMRGYIPQQIIKLQLVSTNTSNQDISEFKVGLIQKITWRGQANNSKQIIDRKTLWEVKTDGCVRDEKQEYQIDIPIPDTPPTDNSSTHIFSIDYVIKIEGGIRVWHIIPSLEVPIIIGTIPIESGVVVDAASTTPEHQKPVSNLPQSTGTISTQMDLGTSLNSNIPPSESDPPTYEEAIRPV